MFGFEHVEKFATEQSLLCFSCLEPVFFQKVDEIIPKISKMPKELIEDQVRALKNVGRHLFGRLKSSENEYHNRSIYHSYTTTDAKEQEFQRDSTTGDETRMPHSGEKYYERRPSPTKAATRDNFKEELRSNDPTISQIIAEETRNLIVELNFDRRRPS